MILLVIGIILAAYSYAKLATRHGKSAILHILLAVFTFVSGYLAAFFVLPVFYVLLSISQLTSFSSVIGLACGGTVSYLVLILIDKLHSDTASTDESLDSHIFGD